MLLAYKSRSAHLVRELEVPGLAVEVREAVLDQRKCHVGRKHRKINGAVAPELLQCDLATGQGLIRMAAGLVREFAAGALEQGRYEALMSGLEVIASLRRQFPRGKGTSALSGKSQSGDTPSDVKKAVERTPFNGSRANAARMLSTTQRPAAAMSAHKNGTSQVAPRLVTRRAAQQRRRQALDFVNAFASEVTAAKPSAGHSQSRAKLRLMGPDTVDTIPKSFL